MYKLPEKISSFKPYDPITGDYKIRLDANESFVNIDDYIEGGIAGVASKVAYNRYPDAAAAELCKTIGECFGVSERYVTTGNGSDELISIITSALLAKGQTVLTCEPDFSMYRFYPAVYELGVESVQKNDELEIDVDALIAKANEINAGMVIFSNPCNPTSTGISREEVLRIVENAPGLVVVDEAYMDFWDQSILDVASNYDNLIVLKTCSKALGCAAMRIGFAVAGEKITDALRAVKSPYNTDSFSQALATALLSQKGIVQQLSGLMIDSRKELYAEIVKLAEKKSDIIKVYPSKTNFVFMKMKDSRSVHQKLLDRSIAVRCFDGYLRITAGTAEENAAIIKELSDILE
ncbi:MAG: histidinol-phosphate aminotransferase family protein [Oscillospiraceae bacterium]|nr:histidinol-phosphate aminotransferase family protein [Oscillospiraceae bacterium]